jgi:hypothetical protein
MQRKRSIARAHEIKLLPFAILRCKNILGAEGHFYRTQTEGKETPNSLRKKGKYAGEFSTLNGAMTNTSAFQTNTQIFFLVRHLRFLNICCRPFRLRIQSWSQLIVRLLSSRGRL